MTHQGQLVGGKYRLDRVIGQGSFATVWAAINTMIDREVALKILSDAPARKKSIVARFINEAKLCANAIHPVIVSVEDIGQTDEGIPYLVMELLEGNSLHQVLKERGSLSCRRPSKSFCPSSKVSARPTRPASSIATSSPRTSSS